MERNLLQIKYGKNLGEFINGRYSLGKWVGAILRRDRDLKDWRM